MRFAAATELKQAGFATPTESKQAATDASDADSIFGDPAGVG